MQIYEIERRKTIVGTLKHQYAGRFYMINVISLTLLIQNQLHLNIY